jgi:hypothetical protein
MAEKLLTWQLQQLLIHYITYVYVYWFICNTQYTSIVKLLMFCI